MSDVAAAPKSEKENRMPLYFATAMIGAVLFLAWVLALNRENDFKKSDFFFYWLGGRLLLEGSNPYSRIEWQNGVEAYGPESILEPAFYYPLPLAVVMRPLSQLPLQAAGRIWVTLSAALVFGSVMLAFYRIDPDRFLKVSFPLMLGVVCFRPVLTTLYWGQISGLLFAVIVLYAWLMENNKAVAAGFLLPLLLLKPQIGIPLIGLTGIWLIMIKAWKPVVAILASSVVFLLVGFLADPVWIPNWIDALRSPAGYVLNISVTMWGLTGLACGSNPTCTTVIGVLISAATLAATIWTLYRCRHLPPLLVLAFISVIVLLANPYLLASDQILALLPVLLLCASLLERTKYMILPAVPVILLSILALSCTYISTRLGSDAWSILISLFSLGASLYLLKTAEPVSMENSPNTVPHSSGASTQNQP